MSDRERKNLNDRLRAAVRSIDPPPYLEARVRNHIRSSRKSPFWQPRFLTAAAAVLVCFGAALAYRLGYLPFVSPSHETYIATVSNQVAGIMRVGLGDHIHCSVFRKYPKDAPTAEQLAAGIPSEFLGLIPVVKAQVPGDYQLIMAHRCRYRLRPFVHLTFRKGSSLLSLVIATKKDGESFQAEGLTPAARQSGIPVYQAGADHFQIAAFETGKYIVYVISDLPPGGNTETMVALAPGVRDLLGRI